MRIGLFGFPQTGKSTLFRLLTGAEAPAHGGRKEVQIGVTKVPDPRLDKLTEMYKPKRRVPATIEYLDLAGMGKGEAADVLPLDQLRVVDALAHLGVRHLDIPITPQKVWQALRDNGVTD